MKKINLVTVIESTKTVTIFRPGYSKRYNTTQSSYIRVLKATRKADKQFYLNGVFYYEWEKVN